MTVSQASQTRIPFGKYKGQTIDAIGKESTGLRYLDWIRGQEWFSEPKMSNLKNAVETYLNHPPIAAALDAAIGD